MHRSDLGFWLLNLFDVRETGEINGRVESILNPKKKPNKAGLRKYTFRDGDTFARSGGIVPIRWLKALGAGKEVKEVQEESSIDSMISQIRSFAKNRR